MNQIAFSIYKVKVEQIKKLYNPYLNSTWRELKESGSTISIQMVQDCINNECLNEVPYSYPEIGNWDLMRHASRVAWLVVNGWDQEKDCLEIDADHLEGHHRLAALIYLDVEYTYACIYSNSLKRLLLDNDNQLDKS